MSLDNPDTQSGAVRDRLVLDAIAMGLYLAILFYAALIALPEGDRIETGLLIPTIWGSAAALAGGHWLVFGLETRLMAGEAVGEAERVLGAAQILAVFAVAALTSIPFLIVGSDGYEAAESLLAVLLAGTTFEITRRIGVGPVKSAIYATGLLLATALIIVAKATIGH